MRKNNEFDTLSPTLYYVFGKAQASDDLTFAYKDDDYIDALCKWMGSDRPQGLIEYIKEGVVVLDWGSNNWEADVDLNYNESQYKTTGNR